ncbi:hypothetical protein [Streptomyces sp. NPDC052092]|uniref:hypothetical protein n=1 Tax=Streptomyces sp. NPDC052092 TaxID=3365685 RepID=UPI0037D23F4D
MGLRGSSSCSVWAGREAEYDYFDATHWTDEWTMGGQTARISIWHRALHAMIEVFTGAGFFRAFQALVTHCREQ